MRNPDRVNYLSTKPDTCLIVAATAARHSIAMSRRFIIYSESETFTGDFDEENLHPCGSYVRRTAARERRTRPGYAELGADRRERHRCAGEVLSDRVRHA